MFSVQNDLFGNLIWIFFFFPPLFPDGIFVLFAVTRNKDVCPMDFKRGDTRLFFFFFQIRIKKIKIMVATFFYPPTLVNRDSSSK